MAYLDLPTIWACIIAFAVFAYVVMDGFDLGIGILFPMFGRGAERDTAMNSVAPVWDGNETWLVLGGGGLMAAFPLAYAVVMPAVDWVLGDVVQGVVHPPHVPLVAEPQPAPVDRARDHRPGG